MAAVTAGLAAAGTLASMYGASQAGKAQREAMGSQERMGQQDLAFRQGMYNRYLGLMGPAEEQLAREARSTQPLDYEMQQAQIKQNYANALRNISTSMGMRGIAGSGLDIGAMRGAAMGQAQDLSGAYAQGLTNRRNLGMALTGRNQIMQAGSQVPGGFQGLSNMYGGWGQQAGQAAAQGWQNFGTNLGNLGFYLQNVNQPPGQQIDYSRAYANAQTPLPGYRPSTLPAANGMVPTPGQL